MEYKKLGDIATYINGYAFKPEQRGSEGLPIIRIQDLTGNAYDLGYYNGDYPKKIELNDGDVLISWSASLGVYLWNRGKALLNQHIFKVVFDKVEIDKFYFMYAVEYNLDKMSLKTHGATMKHITKKDFDNVVIPYPDLDYQKEISYRLTSLKGIIKKYQKQLDLLDELVKARFVEMFGDPVHSEKYGTRKLSSCVAEKSDMVDGPFGSQVNTKVDYIENGEIPVIRTVNVKMMSFSPTDLKYMTREKYETVIRSQVLPGDVILTKVGTIGNVCIFPNAFDEAVLSTTGSCRIRVDNSVVNTQFFAYNLMYLKGKLLEIASAGVQPFLNMNHVKNIDILDVSLEKQKEFADFVKEVDKSRLLSNHSLFLIKSIIF